MIRRVGFLYTERGVFLSTLAAVYVLGLVLAGIVCMVAPRSYESRCVAEPGAMPGLTIGATDPETVCAIMVSKKNLMAASATLELEKRWGYDPETVCGILQKTTTATVQANGKLVEVTVRNQSPADARDIAAEVVRAWGRHMRDEARDFCTKSIDLASNKAEIHRLNAEQYGQDLAACLARKPENPAVPDGIRLKLDRERSLEKAMRDEEARLIAQRETRSIPLVIHEEPVMATKAVSPDVAALFGRWSNGGLLTGLFLAIAAAALTRHLKVRSAATRDAGVNATPEVNW